MSNSKGASNLPANQPASTIRRLSDGNTLAKSSATGSNITYDLCKKRRINEKLAVELLEKLILFVDTSRHKNFKPNNSAALEDIGAVVVSRQFDLRYVCLLWHNIVHRLACVGLAYWSSSNGEFLLFNHSLNDHLSESRKDTTVPLKSCFASPKMRRNGTWCTLADCNQSLRVSVYNTQNSDKSILFALHNAVKNIDHPCDLFLILTESGADAAGTLVRDPYANFAKLHPTLCLRQLSLDFSSYGDGEMTEDQVMHANECAVYCLSIGKHTLRYLGVNLSTLEALPDDWVCESLRDLYVDLNPQGFDAETSGWSEERMLLEFNKQALIPRLFPRLEEISLSAHNWPHLDFVNLSQLAHLKTLALSFWPRETADLANDWRLAALPLVRSLHLRQYKIKFPMPLGEFVPNVTHFKVDIRSVNGCIDLLDEIGASKNSFTQLSELSVRFDLFMWPEEIPPPADVIAFLARLRQLPALSSLEFGVTNDHSVDWCRPGDLALLHVLPSGLSSISLFYCLVPAAVAPGTDDAIFVYDPNVVNAEELIYKTWFLTVIHRLSDFPKLERFYCKIVAPSFHAAVSLAAKWSKSSSAAIADLGLASIINVSCSTDAYLTIESGQTYGRYDCLKFIFTLASKPYLANRKYSARMFTFELEYPHAELQND